MGQRAVVVSGGSTPLARTFREWWQHPNKEPWKTPSLGHLRPMALSDHSQGRNLLHTDWISPSSEPVTSGGLEATMPHSESLLGLGMGPCPWDTWAVGEKGKHLKKKKWNSVRKTDGRVSWETMVLSTRIFKHWATRSLKNHVCYDGSCIHRTWHRGCGTRRTWRLGFSWGRCLPTMYHVILDKWFYLCKLGLFGCKERKPTETSQL